MKDEALKGAIGAEYQKSPWDEKGISMPPLAAPVQEPVATVTSESGNPDVTMSWWHEPPLPVGTKLYTTPPAAQPAVQDKRLKVKLGSQYGSDLNGHWFYLQPADEFADAALHTHTGAAAPEKGQP